MPQGRPVVPDRPGGPLPALARFSSGAPVIAPITRAPITTTVRRARRVAGANLRLVQSWESVAVQPWLVSQRTLTRLAVLTVC